MYLVAIAWIYVVLMMAVAEALSSQGTVLGAFITLLLYGVLPLGIVLYIMGTPLRRRAAQAQPESAIEPVAASAMEPSPPPPMASKAPDGGGVASGGGVAAERKEV